MQQWVCRIQGLENVLGAREIERIGRQIDGVTKINVDFAAEKLFLTASKADSYQKLEKTLSRRGYRLLLDNYLLVSKLQIDALGESEVRRTVEKIIGKHSLIDKIEYFPLSGYVIITHQKAYPLAQTICELNNNTVSARLLTQHFRSRAWHSLKLSALLFSVLMFFTGMTAPYFTDLKGIQIGCWILSISFCSIMLVQATFKQILLARKPVHDLLLLTAVGVGVYHNLWFETGLFTLARVTLLLTESLTNWRLKEKWRQLLFMLPQTCFQMIGGKIEAIESSRIEKGTRLQIKTGDIIAVDGTIINGQVNLQFQGSSDLEDFSYSAGKPVFAGMLVTKGEAELEAGCCFDESRYVQAINALEKSVNERSVTQRRMAKLTDSWMYLATLAAAIFYLVPDLLDQANQPGNVELSLILLVMAGSAGILMSIHISYLYSFFYAAHRGVFFYATEIWKKIGDIECVVMDKTGVLTLEQPEVQDVISLSSASTKEVLQLAVSMAHACKQDKYAPILKYAENGNVKPLNAISTVTHITGGIKADINNTITFLGTQGILKTLGLHNKEVAQTLARWQADGENVYVVADQKRILGVITIGDKIRKELNEFIDVLREQGVRRMSLISEDSEDGCQVIAHRYGFDDCFSEVVSEQKSEKVAAISRDNVVLAIANQAEFFSENVSLALHSNVLRESSMSLNPTQLYSFGSNLITVASLFGISKKLRSRVNQLCIRLSMLKLGLLALVAGGWLGLQGVILIEFLFAVFVLKSTYQPALQPASKRK